MFGVLVTSICLGLAGAEPLATDPAFQQGMALFDQLEFEQAAFRFESAALDPGRPSADRAQIFLWLGIAYANANRFELAEPALEKAFVEDESVAVPPDQSPRVVELIEAARERAAKARVARGQAGTDAGSDAQANGSAGAPAAGSSAPPMLLAGAGVAVAGAACGIASAVLAVLTTQSLAVANDRDQFFEDAKAAQDQANALVTGAMVTGGLGAVLVAGGAVIIGLAFVE